MLVWRIYLANSDVTVGVPVREGMCIIILSSAVSWRGLTAAKIWQFHFWGRRCGLVENCIVVCTKRGRLKHETKFLLTQFCNTRQNLNDKIKKNDLLSITFLNFDHGIIDKMLTVVISILRNSSLEQNIFQMGTFCDIS